MANVRDSDTSLWLHNKLGTSHDLWAGASICSQLNLDVLRNIRECFTDLQSQVKLKLLLAFLHIPRRNVEEWKQELEEILEVALADSDQWVSMVAELLKKYPFNGSFNFQIQENSGVFTDLVAELKKIVRKHGDKNILPLECSYLNKNALSAQIGQISQPIKHFTLKRKPKSAALRAELLQKSTDAASGGRRGSTGTSVPIRCRGVTKDLNDTTPLKGIPRTTFGLSQSFKTPNPANRAGGRMRPTPTGTKAGIKLLDITEQPVSARDAKRKKKTHEEDVSSKPKEEKAGETEITSTPDYAAGLTSMIPPSPAPASYALPATPAPPPTPVSAPSSLPQPPVTQATSHPAVLEVQTIPTPSVATKSQVKGEISSPVKVESSLNIRVVPQSQPQPQAQLQPQVQAQVQQQSQPMQTQIQTNIPTVVAANQPTRVQLQIQPQQPQQQVQQQILMQQQQQQPQVVPQARVQQTIVIQQQQPQQSAQPGKLSLSREQMIEAQEMFKNSNKVTRPEKALILGFMAGSRENPCPHLGHVVTIKLSENLEIVSQPDGNQQNMMTETHYQMNYNTGEGKRIKKCKLIAAPVQGLPQQQVQPQTQPIAPGFPQTQQTV